MWVLVTIANLYLVSCFVFFLIWDRTPIASLFWEICNPRGKPHRSTVINKKKKNSMRTYDGDIKKDSNTFIVYKGSHCRVQNRCLLWKVFYVNWIGRFPNLVFKNFLYCFLLKWTHYDETIFSLTFSCPGQTLSPVNLHVDKT